MGSIPTETPKFDKHVDYNNLPCPVPFEEIHREALMSLKPDSFGGGRFEYIKALGPNFFLSDSVTMGPMEVPSQSPETLKIPASNYEFGANYIDPKISSEPNMSHVMSSIDYTGTDYRTQFQFGSGALLSANSIQVATGQVTSTGMVALGYFQKVSEKLSFTTDFMYTLLSRDATASVGYEAALRQARVRGKIDSNGVATAHVDKRLNPGLGFSLSVEARFNVLVSFFQLDHGKKDYKFGFGLNAGD